MRYTIKVDQAQQLTLGTLEDGALAIVTDGEFAGELFFKNVMGLHSISANRYWPSRTATRPSLITVRTRKCSTFSPS